MKSILRKIRTAYRVFMNKGTDYQCPYCKYSSKGHYQIGLPHQAITDYEIIGAGIRNGGCYKCDSIDRERLLYAYLAEELKVFSNNLNYSILHLAPEWKLSEEFLKYSYNKYICTDKFMPGYQYPKHTIDMDIMDIKFDDNTFDLILCNHVLEHIPNDIGAMKELFRVLKPNGTAILQVPISKKLETTYENPEITTDEDREKYYGQYDHVRIYGKDYADRLRSVGFQVSTINLSERFKKYGVISNEDLYICSKL